MRSAVAQEVERHPLDEELGARPHVALVKRMQHGVSGAVRRRAGAFHRALAVIAGMPPERTLIDFPVVEAIERHAEMLQLDHHLVRLAAHELDRVLVTEVIGTFHRVVHVPVPVVFLVVAERSGHAALRRHGVPLSYANFVRAKLPPAQSSPLLLHVRYR